MLTIFYLPEIISLVEVTVKLLLSFVAVLFLSFLGRKVFRKKRLDLFIASGIFYVLIGVFLGENFLGAITFKHIQLLSPIILFGFAFVGFFEGIQFNFRDFLGVPFKFVLYAMGMSFATFVISLIAGLFFLRNVVNALFFSALAMCFSSAPAVMLLKKDDIEEIKLFAALSGSAEVSAIITSGLIYVLELTSGGGFRLNWTRVGLSFLFPLLLAFLTYLIFQLRLKEGETNALIMGVLAFMAGICSYVGVSPLLVSFAAGFIYVNLPYYIGTTRIIPRLYSLEKPFYFTFLIFTGTLMNFTGAIPLLETALLLIVVRVSALFLSFNFIVRLAGRRISLPFSRLLSMAGIFVVINLMIYLDKLGKKGELLFTAFSIAFLFNELMMLFLSLLKRRIPEIPLTEKASRG